MILRRSNNTASNLYHEYTTIILLYNPCSAWNPPMASFHVLMSPSTAYRDLSHNRYFRLHNSISPRETSVSITNSSLALPQYETDRIISVSPFLLLKKAQSCQHVSFGSTEITITRPSLKLVREFLQIRGNNYTWQLSLQSTKPYAIKIDSTRF